MNRMKADSDHDQSDSDSGREDPEWCEGNTPGFHMARGGSKTRNTRKVTDVNTASIDLFFCNTLTNRRLYSSNLSQH